MSYRLQMSAEIYDWLAELRDSDPPTAVLAAQALATLADGGDRVGSPLVTAATATRPRPEALLAALDRHYQAQLESMNLMRRRVAQAAMLRKDLERQAAEPQPPPDPAGLRDHYRDAVLLASEVLQEARSGQAPEAVAHTFGDTQSFLAEFMPGR